MKLNFVRGAVILFSTLVLAACSNSNNGGGDGEKKTTGNAVQAASSGLAAVAEFLQEKSLGQPGEGQRSIASQKFIQALSAADLPNRKQEKTNLLKSLWQNPNCQPVLPPNQHVCSQPRKPRDPSCELVSMEIKVDGANCPIEAFLKVDATENMDSVLAKVTFEVRVKTEQLQRQLDLTEAHLSATVKIDQERSQGTSRIKAKLGGNGEGPTYGKFEISIDQEMNQSTDSMQFEDKQTYLINGSSLQLRSLGKINLQQSSIQFFVNGEEVNEATYMETASQLQIPGFMRNEKADHENPGDGDSEKNPNLMGLFCSIEVFDAREVSLEDVRNYFEKRDRIDSIPVMTMASCDRGKTEIGVVGLKIDFTEKHAHITVEDKLGGVVRTLNRHRYGVRVDSTQSQDHHFGVTCLPVRNCSEF